MTQPPSPADRLYETGMQAFRAHNSARARVAWTQALQQDPTHARAWAALLRVCHDLPEQLYCLIQLQHAAPGDPRSEVALGRFRRANPDVQARVLPELRQVPGLNGRPPEAIGPSRARHVALSERAQQVTGAGSVQVGRSAPGTEHPRRARTGARDRVPAGYRRAQAGSRGRVGGLAALPRHPRTRSGPAPGRSPGDAPAQPPRPSAAGPYPAGRGPRRREPRPGGLPDRRPDPAAPGHGRSLGAGPGPAPTARPGAGTPDPRRRSVLAAAELPDGAGILPPGGAARPTQPGGPDAPG